MKLAEALITRADLQKRIEQIRKRLTNSAKVQEGEVPPEKPEELLRELDATLEECTNLIKKINKTNSSVEFQEGMTLSEVLAERDAIAIRRSVLSDLLEAASIKHDRYSRSEVKYFSTVDIKGIQKQVDDLSKKYRELDTNIQAKNWTVEIIEE